MDPTVNTVAIDKSLMHCQQPDESFQRELTQRRQALGVVSSSELWLKRSYPVLSVLAPVVSTHRNKIEFPGDPMCLYSALSVAIAEAAETKAVGLSPEAPFNDFCPRWGSYPTYEERMAVRSSGVRELQGQGDDKTDLAVFDPRIWNSAVESFFRRLLRYSSPSIVLVSSVSPAYRYAAQIMCIVKEELPEAIVILGGRHMDETIQYEYASGSLKISESSIVRDICDGDLDPVVDVIMSGQCYYSLPLVLKAISLTSPVQEDITFRPDAGQIANRLRCLSSRASSMKGNSVVVTMNGRQPTAFPLVGSVIELSQLPSPYAAFPIRARFPIFLDQDERTVSRTAHIIASTTCPFDCNFCSEGRNIVSGLRRSRNGDTEWIVNRMLQLSIWGAQAMFFDDSIFLSGSHRRILSLCRGIVDAKREIRADKDALVDKLAFGHSAGRLLVDNFLNLQWGAQFSVSILESFASAGVARDILSAMQNAGCTYIYFGLESLSAKVMEGIDKTHANRNEAPWPIRVRVTLSMVKAARIRAGASVLFGLEGETRETIDATITEVERLLNDGLLDIVSPNLMTYHPGTEITKRHRREGWLRLKNATLGEFIREPYSYFEEAFPGMVSRNLNEELIWHIHRETKRRWGKGRNMNPMPSVDIPVVGRE